MKDRNKNRRPAFKPIISKFNCKIGINPSCTIISGFLSSKNYPPIFEIMRRNQLASPRSILFSEITCNCEQLTLIIYFLIVSLAFTMGGTSFLILLKNDKICSVKNNVLYYYFQKEERMKEKV